MTGSGPVETPSPDWTRIDEEIVCPLCGYGLRGLTTPRCPECGYRFEWSDVLDPARRRHPYLFEHHPERNCWSFVKTLTGGLRPRRFWLSLHPAQPANRRRLALYGLLAYGLYLLTIVSQFILIAALVDRELIAMTQRARATAISRLTQPADAAQRKSANEIIKSHGSIQAYLDQRYPVRTALDLVGPSMQTAYYIGRPYWQPSVLSLFWPWLILATLMVFRTSMRRAGIRSQHVMRCIVYSFDILPWVGLCSFAALVCIEMLAGGRVTVMPAGYVVLVPGQLPILVGMALVLIAMPISAYRLWLAYRLYMRFDHALATVLTAHVVALLLLFTLLVLVRVIIGHPL